MYVHVSCLFFVYIYIYIIVYVTRPSNVCATWWLCRSSGPLVVWQRPSGNSLLRPRYHSHGTECSGDAMHLTHQKLCLAWKNSHEKNYEDYENLKGPVMYSGPCNGLRPACFDTDWFDFMALSSDFGVDSDARGAPAHSLGRSSSSSKMKFVDRCLAAISNNFSGG